MPDNIDALIQDLSDRDPSRRAAAEDRLIAIGAEVVDRLLSHARDARSSSLQFGAETVLRRMGTTAVPRLREIRQHGPGSLRSKALQILVDTTGAEDLDSTDRRAVERLVRVKLLDERPVRVPSEAGRWLAFPAERLDDAVTALGLHDLRPVTTVMGVAATTGATDSIEFHDSQGEKQTAYRVFITPEFENRRTSTELKNWRMLWGNSFLNELDGFAQADKLSEQCGEAHFYVIDPYNDSENWYVARNGQGVRSYGTYDDPQFDGEALPFELDYIESAQEEDNPFPDEAEEYTEGVPEVRVAAANLSVEPGPIRAADTRGHGWLATTRPDIPNARFKGALPI
ncbi:HEAT repeat domain-containing protein [Streptomyces altiplanensis]